MKKDIHIVVDSKIAKEAKHLAISLGRPVSTLYEEAMRLLLEIARDTGMAECVSRCLGSRAESFSILRDRD